jgi:arylformamidase
VEEMMQIYDISVGISPTLAVWPGDPPIEFQRYATIGDVSISNNTMIKMSVHAGTHIDAPNHFFDKADTIEKIPLKVLVGRAYVVDLKNQEKITAKELKNAHIPSRTRRLIIKTRNSNYYAKTTSAFQTDFVGVSADGAQFLVERGVKLVGIDYFSISPYHQTEETHRILLQAGVVIVEGLNLCAVSQGRYSLYCLPLKLEGIDGAPARAILLGV